MPAMPAVTLSPAASIRAVADEVAVLANSARMAELDFSHGDTDLATIDLVRVQRTARRVVRNAQEAIDFIDRANRASAAFNAAAARANERALQTAETEKEAANVR